MATLDRRLERGQRALGCRSGVIQEPSRGLRGRDRLGGGVLVREERDREGGGEKILGRRGRGLCSSESCWEQIRRQSSRRD